MKFWKMAIALVPAMFAHAQQPWQHIQSPTAAQVASRWNDPPSAYGPEPYYSLAGAVDQTVVDRDLDRIKALGFRAVTVQAGRDMPFPYLSDAYFNFFRLFVNEAKKRGLCIWIVDDAGYPSGFAGGKFTELKPELRMQALVVAQRLTAASGEVVKVGVKPDTVGAIAINAANESTESVPINSGIIDWTAPVGKWQVLVIEHQFRTSPTRSETNPKRTKDTSQSLEDYLDPAATEQYLAFTHEQYKKAVGDEFGKTILGFRGDEPDYSIRGIPWTPAIFDRFKEIKGYDVQPYVAGFFAPKLTEQENRAKADYWDVFSILFRDGFFKVQGNWCAANHLEYQVHLNHEEAEMELARSEGDFFRDMRYVQVPGIDAIWHQIWTDTISDYPRLASSAAHVYGRPRAFTESFAAYRPTPDLDQARYILNEQFVRGINLVEAMFLSASSNGDMRLPPFMADAGFPALMEYTRRLSYLMAMGKPAASVALYLPTSSFWLGDDAADRTFVSAERLLSERQIDFDIVDENALAKELIPGRGTLETLSGNRFRTVILPAPMILSEAVVSRLRAFSRTGGRVLFLGCTPSLISERTILNARTATGVDFSWATVVSAQLPPTPTPPAQPPAVAPIPQVIPPDILQALIKAVPEDLKLDAPDTNLRFLKRRLEDATVYLFFNEGSEPLSHRLALMSEAKRAETWHPETGTVERLAFSNKKSALEIELKLKPYETRIVVTR